MSVLEPEQARQRLAHHRLVLGEQDADQAGRLAVHGDAHPQPEAAVRPRAGVELAAEPLHPLAQADQAVPGARAVRRPRRRRRSPRSAAASPGSMRIVAWRAPLWRITFVAPSRTVQASTASTSGGRVDRRVVEPRLDPGRLERDPRAGELAAPASGCGSRRPPRAPRASAVARHGPAARRCGAPPPPGDRGSSRPASCALSAISDRLWPSRSCRSRAKRRRSSATASSASSARACAQLDVRADDAAERDEQHADAQRGRGDRDDRAVVGRRPPLSVTPHRTCCRSPRRSRVEAQREAQPAGGRGVDEQQRPGRALEERQHGRDRRPSRRP